jgi:hypothetical protein
MGDFCPEELEAAEGVIDPRAPSGIPSAHSGIFSSSTNFLGLSTVYIVFFSAVEQVVQIFV